MPFGPLFGELDSVWVTFRVSGLAEEMKNPFCQPIELGFEVPWDRTSKLKTDEISMEFEHFQ